MKKFLKKKWAQLTNPHLKAHRKRHSYSMNIKIKNLTEAQKIALEDLLRTWEGSGNLGASYWTCFFADGDGDFRPKITVNGNKPQATDLITNDMRWKSEIYGIADAYKIDFDWIACKLREML